MQNKISVITVVYNDVEHIRSTMESYFAQTWQDKEYIVIDGGSNDGTAEIIKQYADKIAYWCSEKDEGIYDAMNKGISHATGDWINFLNCGDLYADVYALENAIKVDDIENTDIIYGNSIAVDKNSKTYVFAGNDTLQLRNRPIYRHGSSLIRTEIHRKYLFDVSKKKKFGFALDWDMIFRAYKGGCRFKKVNCYIEAYDVEGMSNQPIKELIYNYRITQDKSFSLSKYIGLQKNILFYKLRKTFIYKYLSAFLKEYVVNDILPHIPSWSLRKRILKTVKLSIGTKSFIMKRNYFMDINKIAIGDYTDINKGCFLDGRGTIIIGNNVSISHEVKIITGSHDMDSGQFEAIYKPIIIDDYVWLGAGCTILQGVHIGKGAVVCAGAVVTNDVNPYEVVAGIPARMIKHRNKDLSYHCIWEVPFT